MAKVFIACSSNDKVSASYLDETKRVCNLLCHLNYDLVYGSYDRSMMGVCAKTFIQNKKDVYGIGTLAYGKANIDTYSELMPNTFERLKRMYSLADIFLILPGGTGTIAELFSILEEFKTNKGNKKLIIYNYNGYYNKLLEFIYDKQKEEIIYADDLSNINIVDSIKDLERVIKDEN